MMSVHPFPVPPAVNGYVCALARGLTRLAQMPYPRARRKAEGWMTLTSPATPPVRAASA